ncbi:MAG: DUF4278 domain-containing protein [Leptolyngbyaceae cyanobacterium SL_7_1]|nr:DUF4278 domain-containing protein [Leptolyngbyaceae cyanobacterium SL_7_1]
MKLRYRGIEYNYQPTTAEPVETSLVGHYRGQRFHFAYPRHIPIPQPLLNLMYRGIGYRTTETGAIETAPQIAPLVAPKAATASKSPAQLRRVRLTEAAKAHHANIRRSLYHRLDVARQKGDETLIQQLERELELFA